MDSNFYQSCNIYAGSRQTVSLSRWRGEALAMELLERRKNSTHKHDEAPNTTPHKRLCVSTRPPGLTLLYVDLINTKRKKKRIFVAHRRYQSEHSASINR